MNEEPLLLQAQREWVHVVHNEEDEAQVGDFITLTFEDYEGRDLYEQDCCIIAVDEETNTYIARNIGVAG
jgi:hypothetical protein